MGFFSEKAPVEEVEPAGISATYDEALRFIVNETRKMSDEMFSDDDAKPGSFLPRLAMASERLEGMTGAVAFVYGKDAIGVEADVKRLARRTHL